MYQGSNYNFRLIHHRIQKTGIAWNGISPSDEESVYEPLIVLTSSIPRRKTQLSFSTMIIPITKIRAIPTLYFATTQGPTLSTTSPYTTPRARATHEYRTGWKLREYGLVATGDKSEVGSPIRQKYLDNHFFGGIFNFGYAHDALRLSGGLSANHYPATTLEISSTWPTQQSSTPQGRSTIATTLHVPMRLSTPVGRREDLSTHLMPMPT